MHHLVFYKYIGPGPSLKKEEHVGYIVLTVLFINIDFWEEMPCSPLDVLQCFRRTSCLHYGSTLMIEAAAVN
jgi:hypothetical protein